MANEFVTNKRTELVLIRSAEAAPYLTVGSKSYLGDQLEGKRNGREYEFVIRDAGEYVSGIDITGHVAASSATAVSVSGSADPSWRISVSTSKDSSSRFSRRSR